jgi:hypothetical protein
MEKFTVKEPTPSKNYIFNTVHTQIEWLRIMTMKIQKDAVKEMVDWGTWFE